MLDLVRALRVETDAAILLIAHNLGVIRSMCDRVGVMYAGKVVEEGPAQQVFDQPNHPYTVGPAQCSATPRRPQGRATAGDDPGQPPADRRDAADLRVRRPLPARHRHLP